MNHVERNILSLFILSSVLQPDNFFQMTQTKKKIPQYNVASSRDNVKE